MLPKQAQNHDLLVGLETSDDAGVYRLSDSVAMVQSVDFFTPIVDDPYDFGRIAAANSLSDIYAMGAKPLTALNLVAFPAVGLDKKILGDILRGGLDKLNEAQVTLLGGHSIDDPEPKFGMAVTGFVHPDRVLANSTARPGDVLLLTKPIGIGSITTAIKQGKAPEQVIRQAVEVMAALNKYAAEAMTSMEDGVHACTDITGFGLLGHVREMAAGSGVSVILHVEQVPVLEAARDYIAQGILPGGSKKNLQAVEPFVTFDPSVKLVDRQLLADAVTSGGLLISVSDDHADELLERLLTAGVSYSTKIGRVVDDPAGTIKVIP